VEKMKMKVSITNWTG